MTLWDSAASVARWIARVVFPFPPFWEITAIVFTSACTPVCLIACVQGYPAGWQAGVHVCQKLGIHGGMQSALPADRQSCLLDGWVSCLPDYWLSCLLAFMKSGLPAIPQSGTPVCRHTRLRDCWHSGLPPSGVSGQGVPFPIRDTHKARLLRNKPAASIFQHYGFLSILLIQRRPPLDRIAPPIAGPRSPTHGLRS